MADDSEHVPKVTHSKPLYTHYKLCDAEWMLVHQIHSVLEVCDVYLSSYIYEILYLGSDRNPAAILW
jgi:hypothetical protein